MADRKSLLIVLGRDVHGPGVPGHGAHADDLWQ